MERNTIDLLRIQVTTHIYFLNAGPWGLLREYVMAIPYKLSWHKYLSLELCRTVDSRAVVIHPEEASHGDTG